MSSGFSYISCMMKTRIKHCAITSANNTPRNRRSFFAFDSLAIASTVVISPTARDISSVFDIEAWSSRSFCNSSLFISHVPHFSFLKNFIRSSSSWSGFLPCQNHTLTTLSFSSGESCEKGLPKSRFDWSLAI